MLVLNMTTAGAETNLQKEPEILIANINFSVTTLSPMLLQRLLSTTKSMLINLLQNLTRLIL